MTANGLFSLNDQNGSMSGCTQNACENLMYSKMVHTFQMQNTFWYSGERSLKRVNVGEKWEKLLIVKMEEKH